MAEERRLEQGRGNGGAVEDDERTQPARAGVVDGLGEDLLAGARLPLEHDRDVRDGELLAERIEATHLPARADHAAKAHGGGERQGCGASDLLEGQGGLADADGLAALEKDHAHPQAVHRRAVRRVEIGQAERVTRELESDVSARDQAIGQPELAERALTDEEAGRGGSVDHQARATIGAVDDREAERRSLARLLRPPLDEDRRGVVIARMRRGHERDVTLRALRRSPASQRARRPRAG